MDVFDTPYEARFDLPAGDRPWLALLDVMQEAATRHAEALGFGLSHLSRTGVTWVMVRNHVRLAPFGELRSVRVATWPSARRKLYAMRDFLVHDPDGNEVLRATTAWLVMRLDTRRPARPDDHLPASAAFPERILEDDWAPLPEIPPVGEGRAFCVEPENIDVNDHVNNLVYVDWSLRAAPPEVVGGRFLAELEIAYLGEARLGDEVRVYAQADVEAGSSVLLQRLQNGAGRELTRLRTTWREAI
jgi:medium-chain acyl-[acyl-carrier-protein] hydrolase